MDNFPELLQLYDITNLPENIRKEYELRRWRNIMAQARYEQDDLPGYLDAEAQARETEIPEEERQRHLARWAMRFEKYGKLSGNPIAKRHYEQQKRKCLDMMCGRQRD